MSGPSQDTQAAAFRGSSRRPWHFGRAQRPLPSAFSEPSTPAQPRIHASLMVSDDTGRAAAGSFLTSERTKPFFLAEEPSQLPPTVDSDVIPPISCLARRAGLPEPKLFGLRAPTDFIFRMKCVYMTSYTKFRRYTISCTRHLKSCVYEIIYDCMFYFIRNVTVFIIIYIYNYI